MGSSSETVNFGKSILVPSVQELSKESITRIPPRYARLSEEMPAVSYDGSLRLSVPVIDLERLDVRGSVDSELKKLHSACKEWGFFQIVNHAVSATLLEEFKLEIEKFFNLPCEEKKRLWQQPDNHEGFGQLFVVSEEQKLDWCDMFYITTLPLNLRKNDLFDKLPPKLRGILDTYTIEMKNLAIVILGHMAKALKMDNQELNETEGLQIHNQGRWVPVKPLPNAFVVNIGDIMEIMSNGVYRSIQHRATANSAKERLSIATFYSCKLDAVLGPARSLIGPRNPAVFQQVSVEKYFKEFFARKLEGKSYLDYMRIRDEENNI